jgi:hypothetical protein
MPDEGICCGEWVFPVGWEIKKARRPNFNFETEAPVTASNVLLPLATQMSHIA